MLVAVALLCCAAWLFAIPFKCRLEGDMQYFCFFILAGCVGGAGVGTLIRRPTSGAIVGFLLAVLGIIVLVAILARNAG